MGGREGGRIIRRERRKEKGRKESKNRNEKCMVRGKEVKKESKRTKRKKELNKKK